VKLNKCIPDIAMRIIERKNSCVQADSVLISNGYAKKPFVKQGLRIVPIIMFASVACSCNFFGGRNSGNEQTQDVNDSIQQSAPAITYNFYIENSGSMKGYFSSVNSNLNTIIYEYYDRIAENNESTDTITLNYINTGIKRLNLSKKEYVNSAKSNCTAQFTKLDDILAMAMDSLRDNHVNIVISDYSFTSNNSSLATAKSGITKLFATRIRNNSDLSVAIIKYNCDFNGNYYPGGIPCNHRLPIYVWAFGPSTQIKKVTQLDIKEPNDIIVLQPWQELKPVYQGKNSRMFDKKDNSVIVSKWKADRHNRLYQLTFDVDMTSVAIDTSYILDKNNYHVTGDYTIESIKANNSDVYTYTISTSHPSPSTISISLINKMPGWIADSNFDGSGVPNEGTTYGIQPLIEGVYDAYHNLNDSYVTFNIKLK
jgi:hypothetical protein